MKKYIFWLIASVFSVIMSAVSCQEGNLDDDNAGGKPEDTGIANVKNPYEDKDVSYLGATVSVKFDASASWTAELELLTSPDEEWARITSSTVSGEGKTNRTVRIAFDENEPTP